MKQLLLVLLSLVIGVYVGWYFGYTRPVTKGYRELKDALHITNMPDKQMAKVGAEIRDNMPEFMERMKRSDDMTATLTKRWSETLPVACSHFRRSKQSLSRPRALSAAVAQLVLARR